MSRCSPLDLMWSLNPIELQGIVVRPSVSATLTPLHPQALLCYRLPPLLPPLLFLSSSTPPKQNFFKCLIFPPFGFLFASALSLVCPSIFFIPLQPLPPSASFPSSSSLSFFCLSPPARRLHLPSLSHSLLLLMQTDLFIYFKLVAQVICGR